MFKISLITDEADYTSISIHLKFRSYFGHYNEVELDLETQDSVTQLKEIFEDLLSFVDESPAFDYPDGSKDPSVILLIGNDKNSKTMVIRSANDLQFFVEETRQFVELSDETPKEGNTFDETFLQRMNELTPLCDPYDIMVCPEEGEGTTADFKGVNPWITPVHDTDLNPASFIPKGMGTALADKFSSFGVIFPYLSETELMEDFQRLSIINEVSDSDLVELIKFGFEGIGKVGDRAVTFVKERQEASDARKAADDAREAARSASERDRVAAEARAQEAETRAQEAEARAQEAEARAQEATDESNASDADPSDKERIKNDVREARDELSQARTKGDAKIVSARNIANRIQRMSRASAEKLREEIAKKSDELPSP